MNPDSSAHATDEKRYIKGHSTFTKDVLFADFNKKKKSLAALYDFIYNTFASVVDI